MPGLVPLLEQVDIISARSMYEMMFPASPLKWKFYAFQNKLQNIFNEMHTLKNIMSFGDSHVEREALRAVTRGLPNTTTKSVKFAERPSLEQLRRQVELVSTCFQYIHTHEGDLDLQLTVTVSMNAEPVNSESSSSSQQHPVHKPVENRSEAKYPTSVASESSDSSGLDSVVGEDDRMPMDESEDSDFGDESEDYFDEDDDFGLSDDDYD